MFSQMKKLRLFKKKFGFRSRGDQFLVTDTLFSNFRSKIKPFFSISNLLVSDQNPHLICLDSQKKSFLPSLQGTFRGFEWLKGLINQTKGLICYIWQSLNQIAKLPQEVFLWI
jgi:hypothetical protein